VLLCLENTKTLYLMFYFPKDCKLSTPKLTNQSVERKMTALKTPKNKQKSLKRLLYVQPF